MSEDGRVDVEEPGRAPDPARWARRVNALLGALAAALLAAAVLKELRRPRGARTWHGTVVGVPYELRPPTPERLRARLWSPDEPRILVPTLFGAGWTVNVGRIARLASRCGRR